MININYRIGLKRTTMVLLICLYPISFILSKNLGVSIIGYFDEIVGVVGILYIAINFLKLKRSDKKIILCLVAITLIGWISNFVFKVANNIFAILIDTLWLWKTFAAYLFGKYYMTSYLRSKVLNSLRKPAKFALVITSACAIISQFINIGMTSYSLYGVFKQFVFIFNNAMQTGWFLCGCMIILSFSMMNKKYYTGFSILFIVACLLTLGTFTAAMIGIYILLTYWIGVFYKRLDEKKKKLKIWHIMLLVIAMLLIGWGSLSQYVFQEAPRSLLIKYGFVTANSYFPLGSGFATYGSEMASKYYSSLYLKYNFSSYWGMCPSDTRFLNDNFFAGIIGQFGWLGSIMYAFILLILFKQINNTHIKSRNKIALLTAFFTIIITMTVSATAKSIMGVWIFLLIGVSIGTVDNNDEIISLK